MEAVPGGTVRGCAQGGRERRVCRRRPAFTIRKSSSSAWQDGKQLSAGRSNPDPKRIEAARAIVTRSDGLLRPSAPCLVTGPRRPPSRSRTAGLLRQKLAGSFGYCREHCSSRHARGQIGRAPAGCGPPAALDDHAVLRGRRRIVPSQVARLPPFPGHCTRRNCFARFSLEPHGIWARPLRSPRSSSHHHQLR